MKHQAWAVIVEDYGADVEVTVYMDKNEAVSAAAEIYGSSVDVRDVDQAVNYDSPVGVHDVPGWPFFACYSPEGGCVSVRPVYIHGEALREAHHGG